MKWEDLDDKHKNWMDFLGSFSPTVNVTYKEIKGYMLDSDCEPGKTYLDSADLRALAESCVAVANWLDLRAETLQTT